MKRRGKRRFALNQEFHWQGMTDTPVPLWQSGTQGTYAFGPMVDCPFTLEHLPGVDEEHEIQAVVTRAYLTFGIDGGIPYHITIHDVAESLALYTTISDTALAANLTPTNWDFDDILGTALHAMNAALDGSFITEFIKEYYPKTCIPLIGNSGEASGWSGSTPPQVQGFYYIHGKVDVTTAFRRQMKERDAFLPDVMEQTGEIVNHRIWWLIMCLTNPSSNGQLIDSAWSLLDVFYKLEHEPSRKLI